MIITNNSRRQALAVFNRITSKYFGFVYSSGNVLSKTNDIADNGVVSVYIRGNNDVVYTSNYHQEETLKRALTKGIIERILPSEQEEQRNFDYANTFNNDPYAYSNR